MHILEWVWRATQEGQAFRRYQQNFPFPVRTDPSMPRDQIAIEVDGREVARFNIISKRSSPMTFTINGVEYRLAFQHSPLKRQPPSRFDSIPSGLTTCTIYRRARGEGKQWYIRYIATVAQFGGYHRDKGRKAALKAVLEEAGWNRELRTAAWEAYIQRKRKPQPRQVPGVVDDVPSASTVKAAA